MHSLIPQDDVGFLLKLPIYPPLLSATRHPTEASGGMDRMSLDEGLGYAACPQDLKASFPSVFEALPCDSSGLLLDYHPAWDGLLALIGVPVLDMKRLLSSILVPNLHCLPESMQASILDKILADWQHLGSDPGLVSVLGDQPFVLASDGARHRPSELYDPSHPLLSLVFCDSAVFPQEPFNSLSWLEVRSPLVILNQAHCINHALSWITAGAAVLWSDAQR